MNSHLKSFSCLPYCRTTDSRGSFSIWSCVGAEVGVVNGSAVGAPVGKKVRGSVTVAKGCAVGSGVSMAGVGDDVRGSVTAPEGSAVGTGVSMLAVGDDVGGPVSMISEGSIVGAEVSTTVDGAPVGSEVGEGVKGVVDVLKPAAEKTTLSTSSKTPDVISFDHT